MNNYTKADILKIAKEKEVRFVRLQFTDILGSIKNVAISVSQLEKALDNQCMFDGSSIQKLKSYSSFPSSPNFKSSIVSPACP